MPTRPFRFRKTIQLLQNLCISMGTSTNPSSQTPSRIQPSGRQRKQIGSASDSRQPSLRPNPPISKRKQNAQSARAPPDDKSSPTDGIRGTAATAGPKTVPRRRAGAEDVGNVLHPALLDLQKNVCEQTMQLTTEAQTVREEIVEMKEKMIRRVNERKVEEEAARAAAEAGQDARSDKLCGVVSEVLLALKHIGPVATNPNSTSTDIAPSIQDKADARKEYVKLCTCLEFLDEGKGIDLFADNSTESTLPLGAFGDGKAIIEGARFILGQVASEEEILCLLNKDVVVFKKDREVKQRLGTYASQGQCRAHENIRNKVTDSFFAHLESDHVLRIGSSATKEEKTKAARLMFNSGNFKTDSAYDNAWYQAWKAEHLENDNDIEVISIFTLGFVFMKITKLIQGMAGIKLRGMRVSHGPSWARETLLLSHKLQELAERLTDDEEEESSEMKLGNFIVARVLTNEEIVKLTSFRG